MIKEVINTIRNGSHPANLQLASNNVADQSEDKQGFFGKMLNTFQQEEQITDTEMQGKNELSGQPAEEDNVAEDSRGELKQALMSLMNRPDQGSQKFTMQGDAQKVKSENPDEILAVKLEVQNAEQGETNEASAKPGLKGSSLPIENTEKAIQPETSIILKTVQADNSTVSGNIDIQLSAGRNIIDGSGQQTGVKVKGSLNPEVLKQAESESLENIGKISKTTEGIQSEQSENPETKDVSKGAKAIGGNATQNIDQPKASLFNTAQISEKEGKTQNERVEQPFQQISQKQVSKNELNGQLHIQNEIKAQHANEERSKRYELQNQSADGKSINGDRLEAVAGNASSGGNQNSSSFSSAPNWLRFQSVTPQKSGELNDPQQAILDEQLKEITDQGDDVSAEKNMNGMNRLGELPVQHAVIRRSVLPGLTNILQKATSSGKEVALNWQKHSFELDDGNKIEVSTRNVDGVIQLKVASSNQELNKLLQQYGQEITEHLENECELSIDLQFNENQDDSLSGFFNDSSSSGKGGSEGRNMFSGAPGTSRPKTEGQIQQSVRRFGYNQMEWTV